MAGALYGPHGFYTRGERPAAHFRTSVHASPLFAEAVLRLAREAGLRAVVDMGAGGGELLCALHALDPDLDLHGVDVAARPAGLPAAVRWSSAQPETGAALLIANEWLDNVPLDVVAGTPDGPRVLEVDACGAERPGPPPDPEDGAWLERWWPVADGERAEVGHTRDRAWAAALARLGRGLAVAVDYAHDRADRPPYGTLTGYRDGRAVPPVPDGSCDLTAHVALDSCAAASRGVAVRTTQRAALHRLGVSGRRPPLDLAGTDPMRYLRGLERAGQAGELTDLAGLGAFGWLVVAIDVPNPLA